MRCLSYGFPGNLQRRIELVNQKEINRLLSASMILALCIYYILLQSRALMLPCYMDVVYSFGSGVKLYQEGHFSNTMMLYGLLNPYVVEGLLRLGAGTGSFILARHAQGFWLILAALGIAGSLRALLNDRISRIAAALAGMSILVSVPASIELLDVRPENPAMAGMALLMWGVLSRRDSKHQSLLVVAASVLLIGARPSNVILIGPAVVLAACRVLDRKSYRDSLLARMRTPLLWAGGTLLFSIILYPSYFIHYSSLLDQLREFYWQRSPHSISISLAALNALLTSGYLLLAFPGPVHAAGISVFAARSIRSGKLDRRLFPLLAGLLPFLLAFLSDENYQPRHMTPLIPVLVTISVLGFHHLLRSGRALFTSAIIILGAVSVTEHADLLGRKFGGGLLDVLDYIAWTRIAPVGGEGEFFAPRMYESTADVCYPLAPFCQTTSGSGGFLVTDRVRPERLVFSSGSDTDWTREVRAFANPGMGSLIIQLRSPWTWRSWGPVNLYDIGGR